MLNFLIKWHFLIIFDYPHLPFIGTSHCYYLLSFKIKNKNTTASVVFYQG